MGFNLRDRIDYWAPAMVGLYRLWEASCRYTVENWSVVERARSAGRHVVFAHFHDETFPLPYLRKMPNERYVAIVSQSKDGEIMARLLEGLGLITARGSKSRGGVKALMQAKRTMQQQDSIGVVTVDGPRGPRHMVKEGAVYLAYKTNALLVPIRIFISRAKVFHKAWDKFQLPLPGARCRIVCGEGYELGQEALSDERLAAAMLELQTRMLALR